MEHTPLADERAVANENRPQERHESENVKANERYPSGFVRQTVTGGDKKVLLYNERC